MLLNDVGFLADTGRNDSNLKIINASIKSGNLSHAYLFYGRDTELLAELALFFAASINCEKNGCGNCRNCSNTLKGIHENMIIVEAEGNFITIDRVVEIQRFMSVSPYSEGYKVCIIKEADLMNRTAANRMLKTLEDPPDDRSIFILLTEDISGLLPTITSRCIIFEWDLCGKEELKLDIDPESLRRLVIEGIKKMMDDFRNYSICLDLSIKILDFLKENIKDGSDSFEKHLMDFRNTGATSGEVKKFENSLRSRIKRKQDKYCNLGINMVFDIITAWLEDMLAVRLGGSESSMNYKDSLSFISSHMDYFENEKIYDLLKGIEKNRSYLKFSIYQELALDNIFLQIQALGSNIKEQKTRI